MKHHLLLAAGLFLLSLIGMAQSNLVIFSEDGDPFYAYVNGIKQNDAALTNVKITGLSQNVSLRIEFEDKAKPQLKQNMVLEQGSEFSVRIKSDAKKQLKLRLFGQTPIANSTSSGATAVAYHSSDVPAYNTATDNSANGSGFTTTTTDNTSFNSTTNTGNGGVNISMPGVNISVPGVNVNTVGMDGGGMNSTMSTTMTSSSSSSSSNQGNSVMNSTPADVSGRNSAEPAHRRHNESCRFAMSQVDFAGMKKSIADKPFSDTKMSTAKVATKNACLDAAQIKEICKLFNMDDEKLDYAKYAYDYCVDRANYYKVSEAFSFSSTTDALNKFLEQ